ncbi:MAG TPA: universal stress protein [Vicinamibacteria bacterium]|jgi:nucleotide-binding universal stress UspA family protein
MSAQANPATVPQRVGDGPEPALLRTILFPSDLSPASDLAFDHVRLLAERFSARVMLAHFVDSRRFRQEVRQELLRRARETAFDHLESLGDQLKVRHHAIVYETGDVGRALVRHARAARPDLTVLATHGRTGLARMVIGSVAERAVRESGQPVLCVREPAHGVALPYRRLLVPTDLTESSCRAFPLAALLAEAFDAEIVAVHVAVLPTVASLSGIPEVVEREVPSAAEIRDFVAPHVGNARLSVAAPSGAPEEGILGTATVAKTDLIVMSTQGHDSLGDRIRGSLTERIVRMAPCPVLAL